MSESPVERWLSTRNGELGVASIINHQPAVLWFSPSKPPTMNVTVIDRDSVSGNLKTLEEWEVLKEQSEDQEQSSLYMLAALLGKSFLAFR